MKIYLILHVNSFKVQHQPFDENWLQKNELSISCGKWDEIAYCLKNFAFFF